MHCACRNLLRGGYSFGFHVIDKLTMWPARRSKWSASVPKALTVSTGEAHSGDDARLSRQAELG